MLTAEGQHLICSLNMEYILYKRVILAFRGLFLPEKRVLQDMICCPSADNKCPFKRIYYYIFGKECLVFGNIICCSFRMYCLAPYNVPPGPTSWSPDIGIMLTKGAWCHSVLLFLLHSALDMIILTASLTCCNSAVL